MLEFTKVFPLGNSITKDDADVVMRCKNIKFDHMFWTIDNFNNVELMYHVIDNIVDINVLEYQSSGHGSFSLLENVLVYADNDKCALLVHHIFDNGCINSDTLNLLTEDIHDYVDDMQEYINLVNYLTRTSLDRFRGFYNIINYYDTCIVLLLVMKRYSKMVTTRWLPSNVIKYLVLPFVYQ